MENEKKDITVKIYIVGSGFNPYQEYDNQLVEELSKKFKKVDIYSYDLEESRQKRKMFGKEYERDNIKVERIIPKEEEKDFKNILSKIEPKENEFYILIDSVGADVIGFKKEDRKYIKNINNFIKKINSENVVNAIFIDWCLCCKKKPLVQEYGETSSDDEKDGDEFSDKNVLIKYARKYKDFNKVDDFPRELVEQIVKLIIEKDKELYESIVYKNSGVEAWKNIKDMVFQSDSNDKEEVLKFAKERIENLENKAIWPLVPKIIKDKILNKIERKEKKLFRK